MSSCPAAGFSSAEKLLGYFYAVKKRMKAKSWHFAKGVLSLMTGTLSVKRLRTSGLGPYSGQHSRHQHWELVPGAAPTK